MEDDTRSSDKDTLSTQIDNYDSKICKHYIQGACPFGFSCKFKHVLILKDIPCAYFSRYQYCEKGPNCPYLHESPFAQTSNISQKECVYYNQGFCEQGKNCKYKHVKRTLCRGCLKFGTCSIKNCSFYHLYYGESKKTSNAIFNDYIKQCYSARHPDSSSIPYKKIFYLCSECLKFGHEFFECPQRAKKDNN